MLLNIHLLLLILGLKIDFCLSANILAVFQFPGLSHFVMFQSFLKELAVRGHNVDVVSHFPLQTPIDRYNDISIRGSSPIITNNLTIGFVRNLSNIQLLRELIVSSGPDICENSFKTPQLQNLKKTVKKYDLVISELFVSDCMLGWAWWFGVPSVVMTSSANLPWAADRFGLSGNPSYIPNYFVEYGTKMTFYERILNTWTLIESKLIYYWYSTRASNRLAKEFFGENLPHLDVLAYNTSLQLVNTHFSVNYVRPSVPNVIEVAGLHIKTPKAVNKHFNDVLTNNKKGVIYFSMGSLILTESLPITTIQAMLDAFGELPYKIIWRGRQENFPSGLRYYDNIHFEHWLPQLDILCDPRVKLFISHGGMMGTQEAVYCGVPILGIPLFADQSLNIKHAESMGFAVMVNYDYITKDSILNAARKLLNNPIYSANAKHISEDFKDRPMSAIDTAIYWVEYVIRHNGAPKLQSGAKSLAWYEYYLLDIVAVFLGIISILVFLVIASIKCFFIKSKLKHKEKIN